MKNFYLRIPVAMGILFFSSSIGQNKSNPTLGYRKGGFVISKESSKPPVSTSWEVVDSHSDEFNYKGKERDFHKKWKDTYFNGWKGPGLTEWTSDNSEVKNGNLILSVSRKSGTDKVHCGVITSKKQIKYPIYSVVRAKVANQVVSSNFWFLSPDDKREIDVLEIYGGDREDQKWFASRPSTNYHVFVREEGSNAIIEDLNDQQHHVLPNQEPWRNDWHLYGAYWKDPFTVDFYYDGKLVYELRESGLKDPEKKGLDRDSYMIIDLEDHAWRSDKGIVATDDELSDKKKNKYLIDFVRTYKPVSEFDGGLIANGSFDDTTLKNWYWKGALSISTDIYENAKNTYALTMGAGASIIQEVEVLPNTDYVLDLKIRNGPAEVEIISVEKVKVLEYSFWRSQFLPFNSGKKNKVYVSIKNTSKKDIMVDLIRLKKK